MRVINKIGRPTVFLNFSLQRISEETFLVFDKHNKLVMDIVTAPMSRLYDLLIQTKNKPHPN